MLLMTPFTTVRYTVSLFNVFSNFCEDLAKIVTQSLATRKLLEMMYAPQIPIVYKRQNL